MRRTSILGPLLAVVALGGLAWWIFGAGETYDVVLYCGVDQDQSRPLVAASGMRVAYFGETEAFRSIGRPKALIAEKDDPKADVYWSNEIMHMIHLADLGIIGPLPKGLAEQFPEQWRDPKGRFIQFGARARILLVNTELLPNAADHPTSVQDLLNPKYATMGLATAMARPLTGTTYTHAVALLTKDTEKAQAFFEATAKAERAGGMKIVKSNGQVMRVVSETSNKVAFGLTDTDDAWISIQRGDPVKVIYPDQADDQPGALLIPNTAGLVYGGPNPAAGEKLLRWLASKDTEAKLAAGPSAQIPVRQSVPVPADGHVKIPGKDFRASVVDWYAVGGNIDRWKDYLTRLFRQPE